VPYAPGSLHRSASSEIKWYIIGSLCWNIEDYSFQIREGFAKHATWVAFDD
jgi:hypothetical protein